MTSIAARSDKGCRPRRPRAARTLYHWPAVGGRRSSHQICLSTNNHL